MSYVSCLDKYAYMSSYYEWVLSILMRMTCKMPFGPCKTLLKILNTECIIPPITLLWKCVHWPPYIITPRAHAQRGVK